MRTREKRSIIWKMPKEELIEVVNKSTTFVEILKRFNMVSKGGNTNTLKRRLVSDRIDFSHISLGVGHNKGKHLFKKRTPLNEILVANSSFSRVCLKKRLLIDNILPNKCAICGIESIWNNKPLVMILDHINGIFNDNRLENLRLLCPNCNSQQITFAGRNNKIDPLLRKGKTNACPHCGEPKQIASKYCHKCVRFSKSNIPKPTIEQLRFDLQTMNWSQIGRKYEVAHTSVIRWAKSYGIIV